MTDDYHALWRQRDEVLAAVNSPDLRRLWSAAAQLAFPGSPGLWNIGTGPWANIALQVILWRAEGITPEQAEAEAKEFRAALSAALRSRLPDDAQIKALRAQRTAELLRDLDLS